jgi:hypothetical protein
VLKKCLASDAAARPCVHDLMCFLRRHLEAGRQNEQCIGTVEDLDTLDANCADAANATVESAARSPPPLTLANQTCLCKAGSLCSYCFHWSHQHGDKNLSSTDYSQNLHLDLS